MYSVVKLSKEAVATNPVSQNDAFVSDYHTPYLDPKKSSSEGPMVTVLWVDAESLKKDYFVLL